MRKLKGFTLVEILIVIVIIGILIGALVPRMQSAQGRARDVARKNDLSQLQAAIVTSYQDKGKRPAVDGCASDSGCNIEDIQAEILAAGMNGVPKDPLSSNVVKGLGDDGDAGQYRYLTVKSYGAEKGGFVLMAKTEVEGGSNWVACDTAGESDVACPADAATSAECKTGNQSSCTWDNDGTPKCSGTYKSTNADYNGAIDKDDDIRDLKPCGSLTKDSSVGTNKCVNARNGSECKYENESQLRYVLFN